MFTIQPVASGGNMNPSQNLSFTERTSVGYVWELSPEGWDRFG
jgi:hypothetical protein